MINPYLETHPCSRLKPYIVDVSSSHNQRVLVFVQVINVYEPRYERAASFWPFIHRNIIIALLIKHITLIGLFSIKKAAASTPFLLPLPILTILFHIYCGQKFLPAFKNYPLQVRGFLLEFHQCATFITRPGLLKRQRLPSS